MSYSVVSLIGPRCKKKCPVSLTSKCPSRGNRGHYLDHSLIHRTPSFSGMPAQGKLKESFVFVGDSTRSCPPPGEVCSPGSARSHRGRTSVPAPWEGPGQAEGASLRFLGSRAQVNAL